MVSLHWHIVSIGFHRGLCQYRSLQKPHTLRRSCPNMKRLARPKIGQTGRLRVEIHTRDAMRFLLSVIGSIQLGSRRSGMSEWERGWSFVEVFKNLIRVALVRFTQLLYTSSRRNAIMCKVCLWFKERVSAMWYWTSVWEEKRRTVMTMVADSRLRVWPELWVSDVISLQLVFSAI